MSSSPPDKPPGALPDDVFSAPTRVVLGDPAVPAVPAATVEADTVASRVPVEPGSVALGLASSAGAAADPVRGGALVPGDRLGGFEILAPLGSGGMADVFLARRVLAEGIDKLAALKVVLPRFRPGTELGQLFLAEARVSATLSHANVVSVFDCGEALGRAYLAMEYVHGRDVRALVQKLRAHGKPPPPELGVTIALEVARSLAYAHTKQDLDGKPLSLVHRDVSPANVLLSVRGEVKLTDFGVVAAAGEELRAGTMVGKLAYMPREQALGGKPLPSWDTFALGAILYELLTLRRPYPVPGPAELKGPPPRRPAPPSEHNPAVPERLDALVLRALAPEGEGRFGPDRWESAEELRLALEQVKASLPPCDLAAVVAAHFGAELSAQQAELERLAGAARERGARGGLLPGWARERLRALQRSAAGSRVGLALARNRGLAYSVLALLLLALAGGGLALAGRLRAGNALAAELAAVDERLLAGRFVGPGGDHALDRLLAARKLAADDERVLARLTALARRFEELGEKAVARGDDVEAAAHFSAALQAAPGSPVATARLAEIEARIRSRAAAPEEP